MFKVGDKVYSVNQGKNMDTGTVVFINNYEVIVVPDGMPQSFGFSYDLEGNHREDKRFSIKKVEQEQ